MPCHTTRPLPTPTIFSIPTHPHRTKFPFRRNTHPPYPPILPGEKRNQRERKREPMPRVITSFLRAHILLSPTEETTKQSQDHNHTHYHRQYYPISPSQCRKTHIPARYRLITHLPAPATSNKASIDCRYNTSTNISPIFPLLSRDSCITFLQILIPLILNRQNPTSSSNCRMRHQ